MPVLKWFSWRSIHFLLCPEGGAFLQFCTLERMLSDLWTDRGILQASWATAQRTEWCFDSYIRNHLLFYKRMSGRKQRLLSCMQAACFILLKVFCFCFCIFLLTVQQASFQPPWQVMMTPSMQGVIMAIGKSRSVYDRCGPEAGFFKVLLPLSFFFFFNVLSSSTLSL